MKLLFVLIAALTLSGCSLFNTKPIEIVSKPVERTPLNLDAPPALNLASIDWIVVTPDNAEVVWKRLIDK